jgi:dihydrolipoamide dehydrogenase
VDHLLPFEDKEAVTVLEKSFKKSGIDILTGTRALSIQKNSTSVSVVTEKDDKKLTIDAEKALCVFGRTPNTDTIGLDAIGVKTERGYVSVGPHCQTSTPGVYAIGDIVNTPLLAHVASKEGEMAVEHMAGLTSIEAVDLDLVPSAIYCEPQIASFGLREERAKVENIPYKKVVFPYSGVGKAVATGHGEGLVKVLYSSETKEILGAHIVGKEATEIIHELLLAKSAELLPDNIAHMIHAHPTISEALMETMRSIDGAPIHM